MPPPAMKFCSQSEGSIPPIMSGPSLMMSVLASLVLSPLGFLPAAIYRNPPGVRAEKARGRGKVQGRPCPQPGCGSGQKSRTRCFFFISDTSWKIACPTAAQR